MARARTSARRRLIGAAVLLGTGVVAFPLIFETQPRPIPVDIPIEIPRKEGQPPVALPPAKPAAAAASKPATGGAETRTEAPREPAPPSSAGAPPVAPAAADRVEPPRTAPTGEARTGNQADTKPEAKVQAKSEPKPAPKPEPKAEAKAAATPAKPAQDSNAATGRFVVQVGAFTEASTVRDVRARVEKLGLATYTQLVDTANGPRTRVRVGPFASREEADKVADKLKAAGLPGAVLSL